jgi:hypothetical protein
MMGMRSPKDVYVILGECYYVVRVIEVFVEKFGWFGGTMEHWRVPRVRRYISHQITSFPSEFWPGWFVADRLNVPKVLVHLRMSRKWRVNL